MSFGNEVFLLVVFMLLRLRSKFITRKNCYLRIFTQEVRAKVVIKLKRVGNVQLTNETVFLDNNFSAVR